ncbi:hypothetical protein O6H91_Y349100 [Diphasiastrum complanatum]|nr:hypothetical protein O6H91_Y349100 [Diphasiastrum complanatum]
MKVCLDTMLVNNSRYIGIPQMFALRKSTYDNQPSHLCCYMEHGWQGESSICSGLGHKSTRIAITYCLNWQAKKARLRHRPHGSQNRGVWEPYHSSVHLDK